jgi:hypothetical protein
MKKILFLSVVLLFGCFNNKGAKVIRVPLEFSSEFPIMKVEIEGNSHSLILDLGSSCEFALKSDVLESLSKKERLGAHTTVDLEGGEHTASKYLLQRIRIQNGEVIHTVVEEDGDIAQNEISGRVGRNVLQTCNLLLDFSRSFLFLVKDFEDLKSENYLPEDFKEVPFSLTRWGAVFNIETDFGAKRFFINTSAPLSGIRAQEKQQHEKINTSKFKIGKVDLESTDLSTVNISSALHDIDGYLGMDFFKKNIIFLDFEKGRALICPVD